MHEANTYKNTSRTDNFTFHDIIEVIECLRYNVQEAQEKWAVGCHVYMSGCVIYILLLLSKPSTRRDNSNKATRYNNAIWKCSDLRLILKQILYQTFHNNKQQQSFSYSRTTKAKQLILRFQRSWNKFKSNT